MLATCFFSAVFFLILLSSGVMANISNCGDISIYRSDNVISQFNPAKTAGRWYEVAYHDIAQVKETCQYYDRSISPSASTDEVGYSESFHFQYPQKSGAFQLFYSVSNTTGVFERFADYPIINKIKFPSVVVDFTVDPITKEYTSLTEFLCYDVSGVSYMEVRIGSRSPTISDAMFKTLESKALLSGIPVKHLSRADQSSCQYSL